MRAARPGRFWPERSSALSLVLLLLANGIAGSAAQQRPYVYATSYPLAYFAARIGDGSFLVLYPRVGARPLRWRPDRAERADMRQAALVFVHGAGYESWDADAVVASERLVDTSARLGTRPSLSEEEDTLRAWPAPPERARSLPMWLDLSLAISQAAAVKDALLRAGLGEPRLLQANFDMLEDELAALDRKLLQSSDGAPVPLVAASPDYDYLGRRYPFSLRSLHWTGRGIPSEAMLLELEVLLWEHPARIMLWQEMPDWPLRQRLEGLGITIVVMPTLARWPDSGDFVSVMRESVARLTEALAATE